jgi:hypothetical protein
VTKGTVISLFDITGIAVEPWAEAGYGCYCYDIQTAAVPHKDYPSGGFIQHIQGNLTSAQVSHSLRYHANVVMVFGWPDCTHLAGCGAKHFASKRIKNPDFQTDAMKMVYLVRDLGEYLGCAYVVENPVGAVSTLWRKPDFIFDPCDYGGYLPEDDEHPLYPEYIEARDAYTKKTCYWAGGGFIMPEENPVEPVIYERVAASGVTVRGSKTFMKLGGRSQKTKNIRSATPRGVTRAIFLHQTGQIRSETLI